jgi:hypothetical protein
MRGWLQSIKYSLAFSKVCGQIPAAVNTPELDKYSVPAGEKFYYPAHKPRNALHTAQMRKEEQHFDL